MLINLELRLGVKNASNLRNSTVERSKEYVRIEAVQKYDTLLKVCQPLSHLGSGTI